MTHQQAVSVVTAPLDSVERVLRQVEHWPRFLLGVERVVLRSHGRYTFALRERSAVRDVEVAVTAHPRDHRIVWCSLGGPRFEGEIRLAAVDAGHTRVSLSLTADPAGFLASLSELLHLGHDSIAVLDLQRLDTLVTEPRT